MPLDPFFTTSHIFHRSFAQKPRHVVSQSGLLLTLEDHDGSDTTTTTILDATGGPAVACLGHTPPAEVTTAITAQLARASYLFTGGGYSESTTEALAAHVLLAGGDAPGGGLTKAVFVGSGSEATDAALKLAAQYWRAAGQPRRARVVARRQSYHGNTLGALAVTGHEGRRAVYAPWMPGNVSFVDACYGYRGRRTEEGETDEAYVARLRAQLVGEFERLGRDTVAAFIAETVGGSTLACVPAVPGYFKMVREVCDEYGVLLILDEVMCGMGRTGTTHAWQHEGIRGPDLQTIGKSLGGGFIPLSGVLVHQRVFDAIASASGGDGALAGGHTFQAHPVACAAALAVQQIIRRDRLLDNVRRMGARLGELLAAQLGAHPLVGDVRGRGLFWAVEFVHDKGRRLPFDLDDDFSGRVVEEGLRQGVQVLRNMGFPGTWKVDSVVICPPFVVKEDELVEIVARLKKALDVVAAPYL